jgi:hypothetical protein
MITEEDHQGSCRPRVPQAFYDAHAEPPHGGVDVVERYQRRPEVLGLRLVLHREQCGLALVGIALRKDARKAFALHGSLLLPGV